MTSYSVTVTQWITYNIEAENEIEAENKVIEDKSWMPENPGEFYDCEVSVEERD